MPIAGGFVGKIIFADLSKGEVRIADLDVADAKKYIGASGINTKLAYELVKPRIDPLGEENVLIYGAGPLVGTTVPGAARTVVTAKSPQTGMFGTSAAGHFGPMLKFAGYDHVVITGKAPRPVYLKIVDDHVSLESAEHLWGKDTYQTVDRIREDLPGAWVSCIGQAGEHQVACAVIVNNKYSTYGSGGLGAVMGSKNLKAIAVRGTGTINIANAARFRKTADRVYQELTAQPHVMEWRRLGTLIQYQPDVPEYGYVGRSGFDMPTFTRTYQKTIWQSPVTCPSCPVGCKARLAVHRDNGQRDEYCVSCPAGSVAIPFGVRAGIPAEQYDDILECAELANRYGISTMQLEALIRFSFDAFEKGLITTADTGGQVLKRGDAALVKNLIRAIAFKEGFGAVLARPFRSVFQALDKGRGRYYFNLDEAWPKDQREDLFPGRSTKYIGPYNTFTFGSHVDPRRGRVANAYSSVTMMPGRSENALRHYCARIGVPEREVDRVVVGGTDGYDVSLLTRYIELYNLVLYSLGSCQRPFVSRVFDIETCATLYEAATGIEVSPAGLLEQAERILTLQRLFNLREGLTPQDEMMPEGFLNPIEEEEYRGVLADYYGGHKWDRGTGIPTPERLAELSLHL